VVLAEAGEARTPGAPMCRSRPTPQPALGAGVREASQMPLDLSGFPGDRRCAGATAGVA
jgi:hypothetical protein